MRGRRAMGDGGGRATTASGSPFPGASQFFVGVKTSLGYICVQVNNLNGWNISMMQTQ